MKTVIVEKSSNREVGRGKDREAALMQAIRREVANSDMLFIYGDTDIEIYRLAAYWENKYSWLPDYLKKHDDMSMQYYRAVDRLKIWTRIKESRMTAFGQKQARPLSEIVGEELAADLELIMAMAKNRWCSLSGPGTNQNWKKAKLDVCDRTRESRGSMFVFAIHEELGILVVAPYHLIKHRPAFVVQMPIASKTQEVKR